ncbi:FAD/NAD(P)-binding domain-containing protein [Lentinula lateritia]|uniref:FAD/NAD(P)-binding domain-containing protein n=1 Tax=Lentinula lateritia TaxID=40482 RepID=A0ABQ8V9S2_9AGAR|nr:FAD/NAD(P)-binding domain-containing protein [Lentinula lateritia]
MSSKSGHWNSRIPTLDKLGVKGLGEIDEMKIAKDWFQSFSFCLTAGDIEGVINLFRDDSLWRDMLSLTWDMRTFDGSSKIRKFLVDRNSSAQMHSFRLGEFVRLQKPFPDLAWIVGMFEFETGTATCSGVFRLVPTAEGPWKAYTMFTLLESFHGFPEKIGVHRDVKALTGRQWQEKREREMKFEDIDPVVLIVGAGQSALQLAARLKFLNIPTLMIEKDARVGDVWRNRYDALSLHFPVWNDHMPYIPFPPTWPKYTPSFKMADWLESYAATLELNIWLSSTVLRATQDNDNKWNVRVQRRDGRERVFKVNHFVVATGLGDGIPNMPNITNSEMFKGTIEHSSLYRRASNYKGKKVIVIGAGNAAHDVASDLAKAGNDVTMFQRSSTFVMDLDKGWKFLGGALFFEGGPPVDMADRLSNSIPHLLLEGGMAQRMTQAIVEDQKEHLDKLAKSGFRVNKGIKDAGILLQLKEKAGGHYFDTGGSQLIIDGKIKLKNDSQIKSYYPGGLEFEDGSRVEADAIICATGVGDMRNSIRQLCGDEVANSCPRLLGVNEEGELNWYRPLSRPGLWMMVGPLQLNRFYSKYLALQILGIEKKIIDLPY